MHFNHYLIGSKLVLMVLHTITNPLEPTGHPCKNFNEYLLGLLSKMPIPHLSFDSRLR